jgi:hypothetical protein
MDHVYAEELERLGVLWTESVPLQVAVRGRDVPSVPGLYQIRRIGSNGWDYIGQTGTGTMGLRKRMAMLKGVYLEEMPYRDPHTAGPGLWALRRSTQTAFEVEFCPVEADTPRRKGLEAVAIAVHRQRYGRSPTLNFGRMPAGYRMSSGNNARLVATGKRFRGGPIIGETDESHLPGIAPLGPLTRDTRADSWGGLTWSPWTPLTLTELGLLAKSNGLYRIAGETPGLAYVGEGLVTARLRTHLAKLGSSTAQGMVFASDAPLFFSCVLNVEWLRNQRLELETDLIAAHVVALRHPPAAQFIG